MCTASGRGGGQLHRTCKPIHAGRSFAARATSRVSSTTEQSCRRCQGMNMWLSWAPEGSSTCSRSGSCRATDKHQHGCLSGALVNILVVVSVVLYVWLMYACHGILHSTAAERLTLNWPELDNNMYYRLLQCQHLIYPHCSACCQSTICHRPTGDPWALAGAQSVS
jgi:hypothetical protein